MDSIQLTGIRCYGYTGYLPEEQVLGQWFEVDVTLWLDLSQAGKSDDIQHTLDYRSAITLIQKLVKDSKFLLIETPSRYYCSSAFRTTVSRKS